MTDTVDTASGDGLMGFAAAEPFSTKAEHAYRMVREHIVLGQLKAASPLNQEALADELGVSITPLREALRRLQAEGLVEVTSHRAAVVAPLRATELRHLYQTRLRLDPFAAALAAANATDTQIAELTALAEVAPQPTVREQLIMNGRFHRSLLAASGNTVLAEICTSLWDRTNRYRHVLLLDRSHDPEVAAEHVEIARAVARRDPAEAEQLLHEHTRSARDLIEQAAADQLEP